MKKPLTIADLYPIALIAHQVQRNIDACQSEDKVIATEKFMQTHLIERYPTAIADKYVIELKWSFFFKRIALSLPVETVSHEQES